jgi:hypothetical protein
MTVETSPRATWEGASGAGCEGLAVVGFNRGRPNAGLIRIPGPWHPERGGHHLSFGLRLRELAPQRCHFRVRLALLDPQREPPCP